MQLWSIVDKAGGEAQGDTGPVLATSHFGECGKGLGMSPNCMSSEPHRDLRPRWADVADNSDEEGDGGLSPPAAAADCMSSNDKAEVEATDAPT